MKPKSVHVFRHSKPRSRKTITSINPQFHRKTIPTFYKRKMLKCFYPYEISIVTI